MSDNIDQRQQAEFTALIDGELPAGQIDRLSQSIRQDHGLRQQLARHQMISSGLRGEHIRPAVLKLVDVVSKRLQSEPTVLVPAGRRRRWIQPLAGTALAASVAALGITFAPQLLKQEQILPNPGIQVVAQPVSVSPAQVVQEQNWKTLQSKPRKELAPYLKEHSEYAPQGVIPYASYVSYDAPNR